MDTTRSDYLTALGRSIKGSVLNWQDELHTINKRSMEPLPRAAVDRVIAKIEAASAGNGHARPNVEKDIERIQNYLKGHPRHLEIDHSLFSTGPMAWRATIRGTNGTSLVVGILASGRGPSIAEALTALAQKIDHN